MCYINSNVIGSDDTLSVSRLYLHRRHSGPINFVSFVAVRSSPIFLILKQFLFKEFI